MSNCAQCICGVRHQDKPRYVSRLEIKRLLHDATWGAVKPTREDVICEFIDRLCDGEIPDVENFKVTIVEAKPGES